MKLVTTRCELKALQNEDLGKAYTGLVPTMGNLHAGHLHLVKESLKKTEKTIVTIFINPLQFGPGEDLDKYPRTLEEDLTKLKELNDNNNLIVFAPSSQDEIFPPGFNTTIEVNGLNSNLCGLNRPHHFKGVTTVVYQLFKISGADLAFFGQKDYQQFKIIEKMVRDLDLPIALEMCPIVRSPTGLALSSRNQYLSNHERDEASIIKETFENLKDLYLKRPQEASLKREEYLFQEPRWQYLEILDADNLEELSPSTTQVLVAGSFMMGDTRLIDNIIFTLNR